MTLMEVMNDLSDFIRHVVNEYSAEQPSGLHQIHVYAGYPPIPSDSRETSSRIYTLVTDFTDGEDGSTAKVEIGFSVYDEDEINGWHSLFNLMEHIRQALLKHRCLKNRTVLVLPVKGEISGSQPYPQWEGRIIASYQIGQPTEEGINYDGF